MKDSRGKATGRDPITPRNREKSRTMTPEERFDRIETNIDKILGGTRDLIAVSRVVLDSIKEMREQHDADYRNVREQHEADYRELRFHQRATTEKLNILIDTVDRIIR